MRGLEIPLAARVFAIVDAFDAMTHDQPYRQALTVAAALSEIEATAGTLFDPELAAAFLTLKSGLDAAAEHDVATPDA